jgi:hypothetical protein
VTMTRHMADVHVQQTNKRIWLLVAIPLIVAVAAFAWANLRHRSPLSFDDASLAISADWKTYEGPGFEFRYPPEFRVRPNDLGNLAFGNGRWRIVFGEIAVPGTEDHLKTLTMPIAPEDISFGSVTGHPPTDPFFSYTYQRGEVAVPVGDGMYALSVELYPDTIEGDQLTAARIVSSFRANDVVAVPVGVP